MKVELSDLSSHEDEQSPIIKLPDDDTWKELLRVKSQQYNLWHQKESEKLKYKPREVRIPTLETSRRGYSRTILEELMRSREIRTWDISRKLLSQQEVFYDSTNFESACATIDSYTKDREKLMHSINNFAI